VWLLDWWPDGVGWELKFFTVWQSYPVAWFLYLLASDCRYFAFDNINNAAVVAVILVMIRVCLVGDIDANCVSSAELGHIRRDGIL